MSATGYHFTGPLVLRHSVSAILPKYDGFIIYFYAEYVSLKLPEIAIINNYFSSSITNNSHFYPTITLTGKGFSQPSITIDKNNYNF